MAKQPESFDTAYKTYARLALLGEGACGWVFRVMDADGQEFALKCLKPEFASTERRKRFKNEMDFCLRTNNANVVKVLDTGVVEWDGIKTPFFVARRYPSTLRSLMKQGLPPAAVLPLFDKILSGVQAAHLLGVLHRDLKPENILCDGIDDVVVGDFGIARFSEELIATSVETKPGDKMANAMYAAPEQKTKGATVDTRADIFALGLILNELFTGEVPHGSGFRSIQSVAPEFAYLDGVVEKMIQWSPGNRPNTIGEIKDVLVGHRNAFVARQRLDEARKDVVTTEEPPQFLPLKRVDVDWNQGRLTFMLDRNPPPGWVDCFIHPRFNHSQVLGAGPNYFKFFNNEARVRAEERDVVQIAQHFDQYVDMANRSYQDAIAQEAKAAEVAKREELRQRIAAEEQRARVLARLRPQ